MNKESGVSMTVEQSERIYLIPSHLRLLRKVWQGRVTVEPVRGGLRYCVDDKPSSATDDTIFHVLAYDGYISHRLTTGEEWACVQTTEMGEETLSALGADQKRFVEMTAEQARLLVDEGVVPWR